jgi:hypothetical protein
MMKAYLMKESLDVSMHLLVAIGTERDKVLFLIAARMAAEFEVMYLQVLHATASLAAPSVTLHYLPLQFAIARRIKSEPRNFGADLVHEACPVTSDRKASC